MSKSFTVDIIRHGEKPDGVILGISQNGKEDENSLTVRGWQRAGALVQVYADKDIEALFACFTSKHLDRPTLTITPLSEFLKIAIDCDYEKQEVQKAVDKILEAAVRTLVCWEHKNIPVFVKALTGEDFPDWPDGRFDMIVRCKWDGDSWKVKQIPMLALGGDSEKKFE